MVKALELRDVGEAIISASNVADETLAIDGQVLVLSAPEGVVRLDLARIRPALHPSPTPVSAPVGVEKWPEPGDKMQFLDRNGYDVELETARKVFTKGQVVTVKKFDLGGWCSSITFEELSGKWNSVMFARSPAVEGK